MKKIYYSPSGNRRIYVRIGEIPYVNNGKTEMIPENAACQFGSRMGPGFFETEDERVQVALEKHELFNREFILFADKAAELLKDVKTIQEVIPETKLIDERAHLVREAKALGITLDLVEAPTEQIRAAVNKAKQALEIPKPVPIVEAPEIKEAPIVESAPETAIPVTLPRRRGRPKAERQA